MSQFAIIGTPLYQWEVGRKMKVIPLRGMSIDSVHFSNYGDTTALVVKPKEENGAFIVDIPNILLQDERNIVVYSVNVSEDKTETIRECVFPVRKRAKPSDYIYSETETFTYKAFEERLKKLEEGGGGVDEAKVKEVIADYLAEHPLNESDPTVPEWAKKPQKPTYTAKDVGALPVDGDPLAVVEVESLNAHDIVSAVEVSVKNPNNEGEYVSMLLGQKRSNGIPAVELFSPKDTPVILNGIADPEQECDAVNKHFLESAIREAVGGIENGTY